MKRILLVTCALALSLAGTAAAKPNRPGLVKPIKVAQSTPSATCVVAEIMASKNGKGIDAGLDEFKAKLESYSPWTQFKKLSRGSAVAELKKPVSIPRANGGKVQLVYKEAVGTRQKPRMELGISVEDKSGTQVLSTSIKLDSGDAVLLAGVPEADSLFILGIHCTAK